MRGAGDRTLSQQKCLFSIEKPVWKPEASTFPFSAIEVHMTSCFILGRTPWFGKIFSCLNRLTRTHLLLTKCWKYFLPSFLRMPKDIAPSFICSGNVLLMWNSQTLRALLVSSRLFEAVAGTINTSHHIESHHSLSTTSLPWTSHLPNKVKKIPIFQHY